MAAENLRSLHVDHPRVRLTKEQIFELYCNQVYMGQQAGFAINGFGEALSAYFNKDVTNLNLAEAAFLAALIRSPNRYNPYTKVETATSRRNQVLDSMAEAGVISQDEAKAAKASPLQVVPARGRIDVSLQMRLISRTTFRTNSAT